MATTTTTVAFLKACAKKKDFYTGTRVHADILKRGLLEKSLNVANALVNMYAKCGALSKAQDLLDGLPTRDVFSWTALITGYAQQGQGYDALNCFERMQHEGLCPDDVTFICILKACGSIGAADKGERIHNEIAKLGLLENNTMLGNALVDMYAKCGALDKAQQVLEELPIRDIITWNALIAGHTQHGQGEDALKCFHKTQHEGLSPDTVTFACVLKACSIIGAGDKGEQIHHEIARQGLLRNNLVLGNALVDMYAKCGNFAKARGVLEELPSRDVVSWNALIAGYAQKGHGQEAVNCFNRMRNEGLSPNSVTFICILKACGSVKELDIGEKIHDEIRRQGLLRRNIVLGNALVDMYAKCGSFEKAQHVLDDLPFESIVSWSALITGYAQRGHGEEAIKCFERMQCKGLVPDAVTFACILKACGSIGAADKGEKFHDEILRQGLLGNNTVLGNALVDMYAQCGALAKAHQVLEELPVRDVISWNVLIAGYTHHGQGQNALKCLEQLQNEGLFPGAVTFTSILKACGSIGAADKGEQIHDEIVRQGLLGNNMVLCNALVDMYAKCGSLDRAQWVLEELVIENVISWSTLIAGYSQKGHVEEALSCFKQMQHKGLIPDVVTFSCVLNACSHSGLVEEGQMFFESMSTEFGIEPDIEHYTCMIDLFGHAGHLDKAITMIQRMPSSGYSAVWCALLSACRIWGDVKVGRWAFEHAIQVDESDATPYVCMANIYAAAGMQEEAKRIESMRERLKHGRSQYVAGGLM